ncbi:hypothetical protein L2E82_39154 [Cichorium intybus]|uniref:Uncharacterized protein n=1 Tax=Cichorium intybus TaxID=13427 RepID=A0ACB9AHP2_CICIN|nr:hypothetical protein L2E82_39154 [Cichorium intybus]
MAEVIVSLQALLELQQSHDNLAEPSSITGFTWKIHKYLVSATKKGPHPHLKRFTYNEMVSATKNFGVDTCLSHKSYRLVYKGWIDKTTYSPSEDNIGLPIVIRRMKFLDNVDRKKLEELKKFSHPNLVQLIGYCLKSDNIVFLVHQFVPNGNFKDLLCDGAVARLALVKKEYMVKLSDYDVMKLVLGDNYLGMGTSDLQCNLSGFTVVFAEVLTGKHDHNQNELQKIDELFIQHGKMSLVDIAKSCLNICNEVNSESKMLRILKEYEQYIKHAGKQVHNQNQLQKIDELFIQHGKMSLVDIAKSCLNICNEVNLESKMLRILKEYEQYIKHVGKQVHQNQLQKIDELFNQHGKMSLVDIAKSCLNICNEVNLESKMLRTLKEYEQYIKHAEKQVHNQNELQKIDESFIQHGKRSLVDISKSLSKYLQ